MKNIKQYKRIKNIIPQYAFGKPSGFGAPGRRALGYEPGEQGDRSGWSNFAGTDLSPAIKVGKKAATQANMAGVMNGLSAITPYAQGYLNSPTTAAASTAAAAGSAFAPVTGALTQATGLVGQVAADGSFALVPATQAASSAGSTAGQTAGQAAGTVAGAAIGGLTALYNGIGLGNAISDTPLVDADTIQSTQDKGTAMANGVKYERIGGVNVGQVEDFQDVLDQQSNANIRSSSIGTGAGIGGLTGAIVGAGNPLTALIGSGLGAALGGLFGSIFGVDQRDEARDMALEINRTTALRNADNRDRAASIGMRKQYYGLNARLGKISLPRLHRYSNGKTSIIKQFNSNGMLLPLNKNYGSNIS